MPPAFLALAPLISKALDMLMPLIQKFLSSTEGQTAATTYNNSNKTSADKDALLGSFNQSLSKGDLSGMTFPTSSDVQLSGAGFGST